MGAHSDLRGAAVRLACGLVVLLAIDVVDLIDGDGNVVEAAGEYPFVFVAWGVGMGIRSLRVRGGRLEDRVGVLARERDEKARAAVTHERARIARELHDVVTHSVTTMVLQATGARQVVRSHPGEAEETLRSAETTGRQALRELRRLLGILRTDEHSRPAPQPGLGEIEPLVCQMREAGLAVRLELEGADSALAPGVALAAYRIVQEALTNVLKHAGSVQTTVLIRHARDELELQIRNAG